MKTDLLRRHCGTPGASVLWDEASSTLLDVFSGKALRVDAARLCEVVERKTPGGEAYLIVVLDGGRQLALAPPGLAFPPDTRNAGPLPGLPQVVCWRDFAAVAGQIEHVLGAHRDEPPGREVLDMLRYCVALLDGARGVGFEVGAEERRLERMLEEVEGRSGKG